MKRTTLKSIMTMSVVAALAAGCGGGDDPDPAAEETKSGRTSTEAPHPRLVVGSDDGVEVLDAAKLESLERISLASRPKLITAGDDRHVFALQYDAKKVAVVDSGSWSEAHGDHSHSYVTEPSLRKTTFDLGTSYHAVSDDERSVVWFDDDGSFVSFDWKGLEDDKVDETRFETKTPHHGVAAPLSDGGFLTSLADGDHAIGVAVLDEKGNEKQRIETCPGLHGEAHVGDDAYAFGCETGALVVDNGKGTSIASPLDGAGSGTLVGDHDSSVLVGDMYGEDNPEAGTHLALYDVDAAKARAVDLGVEFSSFGRSGGQTVALGTDGALHVIDEATGKVVKKFDVVDPWKTSEDWEVPKPQVVIAEGLAYVTDPRDRSLSVYETGSGERRAQTTLAEVPTSLVVTNAH